MLINYRYSTLLYFCLTNLVCLSPALHGQERAVYKGKVLAADSIITLVDVKIINQKANQQVFSDKQGNFLIPYTATDTVTFQLAGWETKTFTGKLYGDSIFLNRESIEIEEVVVTSTKLKTNYETLLEIDKVHNQKEGIYYAGRPPIALLSPFGGKPITFFYELLSKHGRNARKMATTLQQEENKEIIAKFFNKRLIQSIVPIKDEQLEDFILEYSPVASEVEHWNQYDAYIYIKERYEKFNRQQ